MEGNFKKDVILSIPVDVNASIAKGMDINNVELCTTQPPRMHGTKPRQALGIRTAVP